MTEDKAKTKWCPFVRMSPQSATNNRGDYHPNPGNVNCIGSACMAWRWNLIVKKHHQMQMTVPPDEYSNVNGYCGLAGK